jgi:DNA-directed RNA polymerase specialized sigma24 family protein
MTFNELYGYQKAKKNLMLIKQALADHRSRIYAVGGQRFDSVPGGTHSTDKQADALAITVRLEKAVKDAEVKYRRASRLLAKAQTVCDGRLTLLLMLRFEKGLTYREIGREMHSSKSTIGNLMAELQERIADL